MNVRVLLAVGFAAVVLGLWPTGFFSPSPEHVPAHRALSAAGTGGQEPRTRSALEVLSAQTATGGGVTSIETHAQFAPGRIHDHGNLAQHAGETAHVHDPGTLIPPDKPGDPYIHVDDRLPADGTFSGNLDPDTLADEVGAAPETRPNRTLAAGYVPDGTSSAPGLAKHVAPSCTGTGVDGNRVQVVYAHETGTPDRFTQVLSTLKNQVANIDDTFAVSSRQTDGGRRVRWVQTPTCEPDIRRVTLPPGALGADPDTTFDALRAVGYDVPDRKYLLFADATTMLYNGGACGVAEFYLDSSATANYNDGGSSLLSRVDCWTGRTAAHELMHMLGAVQAEAPHATASGHCTDASEIMCYSDSTGTVTQTCPVANANYFDCNNDDYFHTNPAAGSYLATKWNTARSSFLTAVPVLPPAPTVQVVPDQPSGEFGDTFTFRATADRPATYAWSSNERLGCVRAFPSNGVFTLRCPYVRPGTADISVTATAVTDDGQTAAATSAPVHLTPAPAPTVTLSARQAVVVDQPTTYTATGTGKGLMFAWQLNNPRCTINGASNQPRMTFTCDASAYPGQRVSVVVTVTQQDGQRQSQGIDHSIDAPYPDPPVDPEPPVVDPIVTATTIDAQPGYPTRLTGSLVDAATKTNVALAGLPVTVQVQWYGTTSWAPLATVYTDRYGNLSYTPTITTRAGTFRFVNAGDSTYGPAASQGTVFVKVPTRIAAAVRTGRPNLFTATTTTGSGARLVGGRLVLQRRYAGSTKWTKVATETTNAKGMVATKQAPGRKTSYRWVLAATTTHVGSTSRELAVRR